MPKKTYEDIKGELEVAQKKIAVLEASNANLKRDLAQQPIAKIDRLPENVSELQSMVVELRKCYEEEQAKSKKLQKSNNELDRDAKNAIHDTEMMRTILDRDDLFLRLPTDMVLEIAKWIEGCGYECTVKQVVLQNLQRLLANNDLVFVG